MKRWRGYRPEFKNEPPTEKETKLIFTEEKPCTFSVFNFFHLLHPRTVIENCGDLFYGYYSYEYCTSIKDGSKEHNLTERWTDPSVKKHVQQTATAFQSVSSNILKYPQISSTYVYSGSADTLYVCSL